eukprot:Phypoly_transcript_10260.p1 GENE.Phypoly_transcript_10260~~Phypoly_transcript_10260.p1  ORF type:complete len:288 (+),score=47.43 Phypoly_transcript_10260:227-1090(+)
MAEKVEQIPNTASILGEGSIWDVKEGALYWVDIKGKKVHIFKPSDNSHKTFQLDQDVGTVVLRRSGGAMVALTKGFASLDLTTGAYTMVASPDTDPRNRFNDGKCDPEGRFWAGTMEDEETGLFIGSLYFLDADHKAHKKLGEIGVSNGICWSANQKTMYFIDSSLRRVDSFSFDPITGDISNRQKIITIPEGEGWPDGMTIDADGNLWVAHWDGWKVTQWDPSTGKLLRTVKIPVSKVSSVAFGGAGLDELYVTTASIGGDPAPAGALFRVTGLGVKGVPAFEYAG